MREGQDIISDLSADPEMSVFLDTSSMQVIVDVCPTRRISGSPDSMFHTTIVQSSDALANLQIETTKVSTSTPPFHALQALLSLDFFLIKVYMFIFYRKISKSNALSVLVSLKNRVFASLGLSKKIVCVPRGVYAH